MAKTENVYEKISSIEKYLNQLFRTFEDAKECRRCNESCGDMFNNGYKKTLDRLHEIKNEIELLEKRYDQQEKITSLERDCAIIVKEEFFVEEAMEDELLDIGRNKDFFEN